MKKLFFISLFFSMFSLPSAATICDIQAQEPIQLLEAELKRGLKTYKKQKPPIYYLSYTYSELLVRNLWVYAGGVAS